MVKKIINLILENLLDERNKFSNPSIFLKFVSILNVKVINENTSELLI